MEIETQQKQVETLVTLKSLFVILAVFTLTQGFSQDNKTVLHKDSLLIRQIRHPQSPQPKYQKFAISGYVKLVNTFDFGPNIENTSEFVTSSIPVNPDNLEENSRLSFDARQTRIGFDGNFKVNNKIVHTYIETDFYSSETLSDYSLRLRLAYIDFWKLRIGRDWTTFVNLEATPQQVDFEGPNSLPAKRNEMIRFVQNISNNTTLHIAIETHNSDYTPLLDDDPGYNSYPDLVSSITHTKKWGQLSLVALLRNIAYLNNDEDTKYVLGYGANIAGYFNLFDTNGQKDKLSFMAVGGAGIGYYINDLSGAGLDAVSLTENSLDAIQAAGGYVAYQHWWTQSLNSNVVGSFAVLESNNQLPSDTFKSSKYIEINTIARLIKNLNIGIAYLYGNHTLQNDESGDASRLQAFFKYDF
ncbi:MAG: DcaP family trimeric outer membrane transporter [Mesonia hippocampi]|uniref:DcaP family trimeric outer membrane transporter n=1 Tax=Mesonia hippocampi TaxID=1628250 RepID=UPI003F9D1A3F